MPRILFILTFSLINFYSALGQNLNRQIPDSSVLSKRFNFYLLSAKAKVIADSIYNIYGDSSVEVFENKLIKDTALMNSLHISGAAGHDLLISSTYKIPFVIRPLGWTSDYEHIFTTEQIIELDSILSKYEKETTNEIAVVTFDSSYIQNKDFDDLVTSLGNFWHVGKKEKNNGILIGISVAKRKIRISNGYGIEAKLSDEETKKIIDNVIVPEFKKGDYFAGLKNGIFELMQKIK